MKEKPKFPPIEIRRKNNSLGVAILAAIVLGIVLGWLM